MIEIFVHFNPVHAEKNFLYSIKIPKKEKINIYDFHYNQSGVLRKNYREFFVYLFNEKEKPVHKAINLRTILHKEKEYYPFNIFKDTHIKGYNNFHLEKFTCERK